MIELFTRKLDAIQLPKECSIDTIAPDRRCFKFITDFIDDNYYEF